MVQLRTTVTDGAGHYVRDLSANDFRVLENGVEQPIRFLTVPAHPELARTTVFVLFDTSNRMYDTFAYAEDAIADFIRRLPQADAVGVYSFSRNLTRLTRPTLNRVDALTALRNAVSGDDTALYNSILLTLREAARISGNKVLVVFSNGPDNASILAPEDVRAVAEDEGVPIYVVSTKDHNALSRAAFIELTRNTGGQTYIAREWSKQKLAFEAIAQDLDNSYVIGYYSRPSDDTSNRRIEVQLVNDAGHRYRVRTRTGYRPVTMTASR
jgi:VWFA-related protein